MLVTNIPVYDAAALAAGEAVMRGAHGGTTNSYFITAYTGAATECEDMIGILECSSAEGLASKENLGGPGVFMGINADGLPDDAAADGYNYLPAIVSPNVTYFAEYLQTTGNIIDVDNASTSTTITIGSLENNIDGGWLYFTNRVVSTATGAGNLRYLIDSGSGTCTIDSALTVDTTSDCIKVLPTGHRVTALDANALGLLSAVGAGSGIDLHIFENWFSSRSNAREPLRYNWHQGLKGLKNVKIEAEIVMLKHVFTAPVDFATA